jgi:hypothetical protein
VDIIHEVSRVGNCQRQLSEQFNRLLSEFGDLREGIGTLTNALRESHRGQGQDSSTVSQGNIKQKNVTSEEIGYYLPQSSQLRTGKMDLTKVRQAKSAERKVFVGWCRSLSDNFLYEFKTGTVNRMAYDRQTNVLAGLVIEYITNKLQYQATDISIDEVRYLLKATCKASRQRSRINGRASSVTALEEETSDLDDPCEKADWEETSNHPDRSRPRQTSVSDDDSDREFRKKQRVIRDRQEFADAQGCIPADEALHFENQSQQDASGRTQSRRDENGRSSSGSQDKPAGGSGRRGSTARKTRDAEDEDYDEVFSDSEQDASGRTQSRRDENGRSSSGSQDKPAGGSGRRGSTARKTRDADVVASVVETGVAKMAANRRRTEHDRLKNTWATD